MSQSDARLDVHDIDWCGGLEPELDCTMFRKAPSDPEMRESCSVWLFEENGDFAFPRLGIEAQGAVWDRHRYDANFAFRGGRLLRLSNRRPTPPPEDGVLRAGGLAFRCIEPFRRWAVSFDDMVYEGTIEEQIRSEFRVFADGDVPSDPGRKQIRVKFEVELEMAAPGWTQDLRPDKLAGMTEQERADAGMMGFGWRVEQVFRGAGQLTIDGGTRSFNCVGNRIRRQSSRPTMTEFRGHCWQAAVFPDGRAFGLCTYPPRSDGTTYNDGYIWQDGVWHRARAIKAPFLRNIMPEGDDVSLELESDLGITRIEGSTLLGTFHLGNPSLGGFNNNQGSARYRWDGQETIGMIERSSPAELCRVLV